MVQQQGDLGLDEMQILAKRSEGKWTIPSRAWPDGPSVNLRSDRHVVRLQVYPRQLVGGGAGYKCTNEANVLEFANLIYKT